MKNDVTDRERESYKDSKPCCGPGEICGSGHDWNNPFDRRAFLKGLGGATAGTVLALNGMKIEVLATESGSVGGGQCRSAKHWTKVIMEEGYTSQSQASINLNLARQEFLASLPGNTGDPGFDEKFDTVTEDTIPTPPACAPVEDPVPEQSISVEYEQYFTLEVPGGLAWRFTLTMKLDVVYCYPSGV